MEKKYKTSSRTHPQSAFAQSLSPQSHHYALPASPMSDMQGSILSTHRIPNAAAGAGGGGGVSAVGPALSNKHSHRSGGPYSKSRHHATAVRRSGNNISPMDGCVNVVPNKGIAVETNSHGTVGAPVVDARYGRSPDHFDPAGAKALSARTKNEEAIHDLRMRIPEIENIFDVHSRIGNGTFSTVLLGTLKKERLLPEDKRRKFAIKHHIPTSHPDRILKELQCMAKMGGTDNVVGINCCIRYNESVAFIMPYLQHDRFHDFFNRMDLAELQNYMRNLLIALRHVHKFNVIHRDVKPSNFLYNRRRRQFLLVDFGLAQQVQTPYLNALQQALAANNNNNNNIVNNGNTMVPGLPPAPPTVQEVAGAGGVKRTRECDETVDEANGGSAAKRMRCGPHGDHAVAVGASGGGGGSSGNNGFKMPLKQINETPSKFSTMVNLSTTGSNHSGQSNGGGGGVGVAGASLSSGIMATATGNRLQQKIRSLQGQGILGGNGANPNAGGSVTSTSTAPVSGVTSATNPAIGGQGNVGVTGVTIGNAGIVAGGYNTNRNLSASNAAKCYCYGNPQVCNTCLVKKEIHASRAGTPGYRPPEVLLKYPDQTTAVDIWAAGVIFLSVLSSVYPFFKAPNDYVALAEMVTIFGDKSIRKTAYLLDRLVTLNQKTRPLDLRKLCVRFRNRTKFSSPELLKRNQNPDGTCEVCKNCDQFFFNCLCMDSRYTTEPLDNDDHFPASAYDLLYRLLEVNPHKRITAEEALNHPFFSESDEKVVRRNSDGDAIANDTSSTSSPTTPAFNHHHHHHHHNNNSNNTSHNQSAMVNSYTPAVTATTNNNNNNTNSNRLNNISEIQN